MLALHAEGASTREIGEALKVSHITAAAWLKDAGLAPNGGYGARNGRHRVKPGGTADLAGAQWTLAELAAVPAPTDLAGVLGKLRENYGLVSALVEFHVKGAKAGTSSMAELDKAISLQERFAVKIAELTPRETANPESDSANLEAASAVERKLMSLIEPARRSARCSHCGKNPFGVRV